MNILCKKWLACLIATLTLLQSAPGQQNYDPKLEAWFSQFQYKTAEQYLTKSLGKSTVLQSPHQLYHAQKLAQIFAKKGDNKASLYWAKLALQYIDVTQDSALIADVRLTASHALIGIGKFDEAVPLLKEAENTGNKLAMPRIRHKCLQEYGNLSLINGQFKEAESFFRQCTQLEKTHNIPSETSQNLINLGLLFCSVNQLDSAALYLHQTLDVADRQRDTIMLSLAHAVQAYYYLLKNNRTQWKSEIIRSIEFARKIEHNMLISNGYTQLMEFSLVENHARDAIQYGVQAKQLLQQGKMPLFEANVDSLLYEAYKLDRQPENALASFESYYRAKNRILTQTQFEALQTLKAEHALNEKNLVIALQSKDLENAQRKQQILSLVVIFLGAILLFILTIYWLKRRQNLYLFQKEKLMESMLEGRHFQKQIQSPSLISALEIPEENSNHPSEENNLEEINEDHKELYEEMMRLIEERKLYLNPQLDQKLLVTLLRTNKSYLYRAISQHGSDHFKNIINHFRVRDAKKLLESQCEEGKKELPEDIYSQAGFNSVTSYYRSFRHFTGLTPKEYMQEYLKDLQKSKSQQPR